MATSTPNHGLYKYGGGDAPDLTKLGPTMDKIDLELKKNATDIGLLGSPLKSLGNITTQNANSMGIGFGRITVNNPASLNWPLGYGTYLCFGHTVYLTQIVVQVSTTPNIFVRSSLDTGSSWTPWVSK